MDFNPVSMANIMWLFFVQHFYFHFVRAYLRVCSELSQQKDRSLGGTWIMVVELIQEFMCRVNANWERLACHLVNDFILA